jgi:hypothetical protein
LSKRSNRNADIPIGQRARPAHVGRSGRGRQGASADEFSAKQLWESARHETAEEIYGKPEHEGNVSQHFPKKFKPSKEPVVYDTNPNNPNSFKFYTFVVEIPLNEKKRMTNAWENWREHPNQWENEDMKWFPIAELRSHIKPTDAYQSPHQFSGGDLHHGVAYVMDHHPYFKKDQVQQLPAQQTPELPEPQVEPTGQTKLFNRNWKKKYY